MNRRTWAYIGLGVVFLAVGGPAFVASYRHAISVVQKYGAASDQVLAGWMPLTTDGMLILVLIVMGVRRLSGQPVGWLPWTAFGAGMIATIAANLAAAPIDPSSWGATVGALAVALWPPVTVMLTLELGAISLEAIRRWDSPAPTVEPLTQSEVLTESHTLPPSAEVAPPVEPRTVAEAVAESTAWTFDDAVAWAVREGAGAKRIQSHTGLSEHHSKRAAAEAKTRRGLRVAR